MSIVQDKIAATEPGLRELETELLRLPAEVREHLGNLLLGSLEPAADAIALAWREETQRRWLAYERGETKAISAEESIAELHAILRQCG